MARTCHSPNELTMNTISTILNSSEPAIYLGASHGAHEASRPRSGCRRGKAIRRPTFPRFAAMSEPRCLPLLMRTSEHFAIARRTFVKWELGCDTLACTPDSCPQSPCSATPPKSMTTHVYSRSAHEMNFMIDFLSQFKVVGDATTTGSVKPVGVCAYFHQA
ncbi:hypothetical protein H4582DRAFT_985100 [Lactarius indigo]|nr:hypothetical protein H4582DRAFT_985100 [Lactarius indigo]